MKISLKAFIVFQIGIMLLLGIIYYIFINPHIKACPHKNSNCANTILCECDYLMCDCIYKDENGINRIIECPNNKKK